MLNIILCPLFTMVFFLHGCSANYNNNETTTEYNLSRPDLTLILPDILNEVSGITNIDAKTFACVQDENGILFIYDVHKNQIKKQFTFNIDGDYEGITRVGQTIYVLRSDGTLFEIVNYTSENFELKTHYTGIPANNSEGLCYDKANNRLLIACKGKISKEDEHKDKRVIYGFDLSKKVLTNEPTFIFDLQVIRDFALKNKVDLPKKKTKKKGKSSEELMLKFKTSAICIHPITKKLFLLSASDHLLFIFNMKGDIEHLELLNAKIFNKAEGITFYENGDMLITNEGQDKDATLLQFTYKKNKN